MELYQYYQYTSIQKENIEDKEKAEQLKKRLLPFADIDNLEDAKKKAKEILPTNQEYTSFYVGSAKCSIINKSDLFRVCYDSANEFICYDFT